MRDLSLRSPDGSKVLGLFTPPAGSPDIVVDALIRLALERAPHVSPCVLWVNWQPVCRFSEEASS